MLGSVGQVLCGDASHQGVGWKAQRERERERERENRTDEVEQATLGKYFNF